MPRLEAAQIDLSESERQELVQLLRRTSTPQQVALRAKIILRAAVSNLTRVTTYQTTATLASGDSDRLCHFERSVAVATTSDRS